MYRWCDCLRRWVIAPAPVPYCGLINQGATCYLNSVLQVLFMTKDFREAVNRYRSENPENKVYIDHHLSAIFEKLAYETATTYGITKALDIKNVYEQQDAAEYFQSILQLTNPEASKIFHGQMSHRTSCHKCLKQADVDESFWYLPLALMDSLNYIYSVVDGVGQFFMASEFRGENQMYCDDCDDKVDASTKYVIKHHPDVLMLLLKRFDFSYRHMSYIKINCDVKVPLILQIPESQTYELYAVVNHAGDLRSGHYNAIIRSDFDGRWYWFDDTSVGLLDNQPFQRTHFEQSSTAYLLFYRKLKSNVDHNMMEVCTNETAPVLPHDDGIQCWDARQREEEDEEERANMTDKSVNIRVESEVSVIPSSDEVRSDLHQHYDEGKNGVHGNPQDAHNRIKCEGTDHKEDKWERVFKRKPDCEYQEVGEQIKPEEDQMLKDGGSTSREERRDKEKCDRQDEEINVKQRENEDVNMQKQVREQEEDGEKRRRKQTRSQRGSDDDDEEEEVTPKDKGERQRSTHKDLIVKIIEEEFLVTPRCIIKIKPDTIETKTLRTILRGNSEKEGKDNSTCSDPQQITTKAQEKGEAVPSDANIYFSDVQVKNQAMKKRSKPKKRVPLKQCIQKKKKAARQYLFFWKRWRGSRIRVKKIISKSLQ